MGTYGVISAFYKPHMGGVESYTENLAAELVGMGHRVIVITSSMDGEKALEEQGRLSVVRLPSCTLMGERFPMLLAGREWKRARRWLSKQSLDGVLVNTRYYPISLFGLSLAKKQRVPAIVLDHSSGYLSSDKTLGGFVVRMWERFVTLLVKCYHPGFYTVSAKSFQWMQSLGIQPKGYLYNAINSPQFASMASSRNFKQDLGLPASSFLVSFAGRLLPEKGVVKLSRAIKELESDYPTIHLVVAGEGPAKSELQGLKTQNVHLVGRLEKPDLAALLAQSEVFCFPSDYPEGLPTVLLEAAASECGLIVSQVGGADELLPSLSCGIKLETTSIEDIESAIVQMFDNPRMRQSMAREAKHNVIENYTWQKTANSFIGAFE